MSNIPCVIIDGVRYIPDPKQPPNKAHVWYLHDNGSVNALSGSLSDIVSQARALALESPGGMLCNVILLHDECEVRRLKEFVHAHEELGDVSKWVAEIKADPDASKLLTD
jgi:hypothetical protein